jgi:ADP-heptose:LPS heptosyltransferase
VLGNSGLVHGYMRYSAGTRNPIELLRLAAEIRRFKPDLVVYLMYTRPWKAVRRDRLFFRLAGVRRIVGFATEQEMKSQFDSSTGLYEGEPFRIARLIAELGEADPSNLANWDLVLSDEERKAAITALGPLAGRPLIVCGPGTKMPAKDWGPENWQSLLARIDKKYPGHALALVGAKEEFRVAEYTAQAWTGPKINLCGNLPPRETAALLDHAKLFLGPDSGPMHLAESRGVPCVIPFSAVVPAGIWFPQGNNHQVIYHRPPCSGCYLERCNATGHPCLTSITVGDMEAAVDAAMTGQPGKETLTTIS